VLSNRGVTQRRKDAKKTREAQPKIEPGGMSSSLTVLSSDLSFSCLLCAFA
jgi:hypothetical protein